MPTPTELFAGEVLALALSLMPGIGRTSWDFEHDLAVFAGSNGSSDNPLNDAIGYICLAAPLFVLMFSHGPLLAGDD